MKQHEENAQTTYAIGDLVRIGEKHSHFRNRLSVVTAVSQQRSELGYRRVTVTALPTPFDKEWAGIHLPNEWVTRVTVTG